MNKERYLSNRKTLMDEAQTLLNDGKTDEANAKLKEVEALDAQYEADAKAKANFNALLNKQMPAGLAGAAAIGVSGTVVDSLGAGSAADLYDSPEYKRAFQAYVLCGTPIPDTFCNADATTKTTDVPSVIPTTTLQKIYEKMERIGMILPLVTQTAYPGGLSVPTSSVKPVATWVAEGAGSDKQKLSTGTITFASYKLRCAVSMTYETDNMAYPMFETLFVNGVADAMVKAKETAIIKGSGVGQPKGILKETAAGNVNIAKGTKITYADFCEAEGLEEDEGAVWVMTKKTYMSQVAGMVDADGQPVARVNMGVGGRPEYSILGRRVVLANSSYMDSWAASVTADSVIAFLYNFSDYILNSGVALAVKRYYDEDVDDTITKAIEICDGKSVRNDSLITVTLKNA